MAVVVEPRFETYGRYVLLDALATGGMAEVFLAKPLDGLATPLVALKRLRPELASDPEFTGMFLDEARISGRLTHPHIVPLRELGRVDRSHYLAMDFVWGKDLLHIVRRCRQLGAMLPPGFVLHIGRQLTAALHHAHELRDAAGRPMHVVHRDVSPQNVLVGFDGRVRVIDFGIAKAAARVTRTQDGVLKGKIGYMSPEQARGREVDHRSDVFAAATCLYELLTLRSLFARADTMQSLDNVRNARVPPLTERRHDVPDALQTALMKALALNPDDRFASAGALGDALNAALEENAPGFSDADVAGWMAQLFLKERREEGARIDALSRIGRAQLWRQGDPDPLTRQASPAPRRLAEGFEVLWERDHAVPTHPTALPSESPADVPTQVLEPTPSAPTAEPSLPLANSQAPRPRVHSERAGAKSGPAGEVVFPRPAALPAFEGYPLPSAPPVDGTPPPASAHPTSLLPPQKAPPAATSRLGLVVVALIVLVVGSLAAFVWWWVATGHPLLPG
ncbi:MAG: serine/threonine protein kinase [Sandaracinaceae bacterium]